MNRFYIYKDFGSTQELAYRALLDEAALTLTNSSHMLRRGYRVDDVNCSSLHLS
jgi:hypothetical protein